MKINGYFESFHSVKFCERLTRFTFVYLLQGEDRPSMGGRLARLVYVYHKFMPNNGPFTQASWEAFSIVAL